MENKTISYLNAKAWYRLLKVTYSFAFLLASLIAVLVMREVYGTSTTSTDYLVICKNTRITTFFARKDKDIYLTPSDFQNGAEGLPKRYLDQLQEACGL